MAKLRCEGFGQRRLESSLVSFSDHWAERLLAGTGALPSAELCNGLQDALNRDG